MNLERVNTLKRLLEMNWWKIDIEKGIIENTKGIVKSVDERGYLVTAGYIDGKVRSYKVHEVIAVAGGMDVVDMTINHIDGNKQNNAFNNLEPLSAIDNAKHAHKTGLFDYSKRSGEKHGKTVITEEQARQVKVLLSKGMTQGNISKETGVKIHTIKDIRRGRTWGWLEI